MMNVMKRGLFVLVLTCGISLSNPAPVQAQCAMCSLTAQNATENGNQQGQGLNDAILYLLAMPYLAALGIGILWYKRYRTKKNVRIEDGPISLN